MSHKLNNKNIGKLVRAFRKSNKINQTKLGKRLGLHQTAICRIEQGSQDLTVLQLIKLCTVFRIWESYFFSALRDGRFENEKSKK